MQHDWRAQPGLAKLPLSVLYGMVLAHIAWMRSEYKIFVGKPEGKEHTEGYY
jgi:hypothetical protein